MNSYRIDSLYSGSGGNATLVRTPGACILIDAGKNARALTEALRQVGTEPEALDAIFVTHDHRDHISALPVLTRKCSLPVHAVEATAQVIAEGAPPTLRECLRKHPPLYEERVGDVTVRSFITPHDSRFSVGYRIELTDAWGRRHAIGYATDIGYVTDEVRAGLYGCESVVLESNHDRDMLLGGPYPRPLKERVLSRYGHLSNEDCAALAAELAAAGMRHLMLAHLSEQNNDPALAYQEVLTSLGDETFDLSVASPDLPVTMTVLLPEDGERSGQVPVPVSERRTGKGEEEPC